MKQEVKSQKTKQLIADVACQLFEEKGYQKATMAEIVNRTHLSKGAVYHHFESKEAIVNYLMQKEVERVTGYFKELSERTNESARNRLLELVDRMISNESGQQLLRLNWVDKIPFGLLFTLKNTINRLSKYIANIISQGNMQGEFACLYPSETAVTFSILVDIWLDDKIADDMEIELEKRIDYPAFYLELSGVVLFTEDELRKIKLYLRKGEKNE